MKIGMGLAAVTVVLVAQIASVSAAENPFKAELLRRACKEYAAVYTARETFESSADWTDPGKIPSLWAKYQDRWDRVTDAEQQVINHLPDDDIERLQAIANVQRAISTVPDDGPWPLSGTVGVLLVELGAKALETREAAIVHFCA